MSNVNNGIIGTPQFKPSALTMAIAVAIATQPKQEDEPHWLDAEEGPLCERFDNFLNKLNRCFLIWVTYSTTWR